MPARAPALVRPRQHGSLRGAARRGFARHAVRAVERARVRPCAPAQPTMAAAHATIAQQVRDAEGERRRGRRTAAMRQTRPACAPRTASQNDHRTPRASACHGRPSERGRGRSRRSRHALASITGPCAIITAPDTSSPLDAARVAGEQIEPAVADAVLLAQVAGQTVAPAMHAHGVAAEDQAMAGARPAGS